MECTEVKVHRGSHEPETVLSVTAYKSVSLYLFKARRLSNKVLTFQGCVLMSV